MNRDDLISLIILLLRWSRHLRNHRAHEVVRGLGARVGAVMKRGAFIAAATLIGGALIVSAAWYARRVSDERRHVLSFSWQYTSGADSGVHTNVHMDRLSLPDCIRHGELWLSDMRKQQLQRPLAYTCEVGNTAYSAGRP